ncbi:unnamed protein product [Blepharisma stoltei]|uniref:Uncharacterized protein n=1 Tax=Blepharisma stoltei TaxID=1481888 RepID=A0AAU9JIV3_9CILI|nr:unnamed protein product [Blepharisma stoltei]
MATIASRNYMDSDVVLMKTRHDDMLMHKFNIKNARKAIDNSTPQSFKKSPSKLRYKLLEISKSKGNYNFGSLTPIKSLNLEYRKKEAKKIDDENYNLAARLITKESQLNFKKLDEEYKNSITYRDRISRVTRINLAKKLVEKEWPIATTERSCSNFRNLQESKRSLS